MELIVGPYEKCIEYCRNNRNEDCYVFDFPYISMSEYFREINRFLWESRHQFTRFSNNYAGKVVVDITAWNQASVNEYFDAFLYFLKDRESSLNCTFISEVDYTEAVNEHVSRLFSAYVVRFDTGNRTAAVRIGFAVNEKEDRTYV